MTYDIINVGILIAILVNFVVRLRRNLDRLANGKTSGVQPVAGPSPALPPVKEIPFWSEAVRKNTPPPRVSLLHRIERMDDIAGATWLTFGGEGSGVYQFASPTGIAVDELGRIYVADYYNNRIVRMDDMTGAGWTVLGRGREEIRRFWPRFIAIDRADRVYVTDSSDP